MVDSEAPPPTDWGDPPIAQTIHDLNSQLTLIRGCAVALAETVARGNTGPDLTSLQMSAERASHLARQLLSPSGSRLAPRMILDFNHVVASTGQMLACLAGPRHIVRVQLSTEALMVHARIEELERIVLNLALNAVESLTLPGAVTIQTDRVGQLARLMIMDSGAGMPPEIKERMFEPFFTTKSAGTGLGMTSVAFTVRQLEGTLAVDSTLGHGTTVTVLLPTTG